MLGSRKVVCDVLGNFSADKLNLTDVRITRAVVAHNAEVSVFADRLSDVDFAVGIIFGFAVRVLNITANVAAAVGNRDNRAHLAVAEHAQVNERILLLQHIAHN